MAVGRASVARLASGLIAVVVVSVSAARSTTRQGHVQVIARTHHHAIRRPSLDCSGLTADGRLCARVLSLLISYARPQRARCLQVWGGKASARITGVAQ